MSEDLNGIKEERNGHYRKMQVKFYVVNCKLCLLQIYRLFITFLFDLCKGFTDMISLLYS